MFDILIANGWIETAPGRGGVRRQFEREAKHANLRIEELEAELWLWIRGDGDRWVMSMREPAKFPQFLARLVAKQDELSHAEYLGQMFEFQEIGDVATVCIEQYERTCDNLLPEHGDALMKFFTDVIGYAAQNQHPKLGACEVTLGDIGAPSAWSALKLAIGGLQYQPKVMYTIPFHQYPDPRFAKAKVKHLLWRYDGILPQATVPAPSPAILDALGAIARQGFSLGDWETQAAALAARLGPAWEQLFGVMAHGGPAPDIFGEFDWICRLQIVAALALANLDPDWETGRGRRALIDLALGPVDWTVTAAILVLARVANRNPKARPEVERIFGYLKRQTPRRGYTSYAPPLAIVWLNTLGGLSGEAIDEMKAYGREAWGGGQDELATHGGVDLAGYAELCEQRDTLLARQGSDIELARLNQEYDATSATFAEWDRALAASAELAREFQVEKAHARQRLRMQALDPLSPEAAQVLSRDPYTAIDRAVETAKAVAAQAKLAAAPAEDPDPLVFPGQKVAKLSDYVAMMKRMQTGDMAGAIARFGLDMAGYAQVMQAWGGKLASDPMLNAKMAKLMMG